MPHERYPDCTNCEAPCCRRQFMEDDDGWYSLKDARPIYLEAGTDIKVVGWHKQKEGRQPVFECQAFNTQTLSCGVYDKRPEHCRTYDCRDDDPDEWQQRPHCDIERHRNMDALRAKATA
jgi:Fe-S-cluster containining protein